MQNQSAMPAVKLTLELIVAASQLDKFKRIAGEMNEIVSSNEPDTLSCKWFYHEGDNKWCLTEKFRDSDAFLRHLGAISQQMDQILEISEVSRFDVFGDMALAAKAAIAPFGARHYTYWKGATH
jgi:hypothetical protein